MYITITDDDVIKQRKHETLRREKKYIINLIDVHPLDVQPACTPNIAYF
jgi:hypothetical protein